MTNTMIYIGGIMGLVNLWVTNQCNLNCMYCYEGSKKDKIFQQEYVEPLILFIKEFAMEVPQEELMINFHGGEPLLNFDMIRTVVKRLKQENMRANYSFTTNGLLINEYMVQFIKENDIYLSISLDGGKEINDKNRVDYAGNGTYDRVMKQIALLKDYGVSYRTRMTVIPETASQLFDSVITLIEQGCTNLVAAPDLFAKTWNDQLLKTLEQQLIQVYDYVAIMEEVDFVFYMNEIKKKGFCDGGIREFSVDADGAVYPCTYVVGEQKHKIGSIFSGIHKEIVDEFISIYSKNNENCSGCSYSQFCMANRCKFLNYLITNQYLVGPDIICEIENMMLRLHKSGYITS